MHRRVEDMTGRIPLYLGCFVGCTPDTFAATWQDVFAQDRRVRRVMHHLLVFYEEWKDSHSEQRWRSHVATLRSFLLGGKPHSDEYDHRYLYEDEKGFGFIACGLARACLVSVLRMLDSDHHFVDGAFLSNLKTTRNPSMRGFLIEQACLTYVLHNGLLLPGDAGLVKPDKVVYFDAGAEAATVSAAAQAACVLYIPRPYNYKAIDALLRRLTFSQNEQGQRVVTSVLLVPIQVTISTSHKPSPDAFYPTHDVWLEDIDAGVQRQHVFVWLRRDAQASVSHAEHVRRTRGQEIVTPVFDEVTVPFNTLSGDLHVSTSPPRAVASSSVQAARDIAPLAFSLQGQCMCTTCSGWHTLCARSLLCCMLRCLCWPDAMDVDNAAAAPAATAIAALAAAAAAPASAAATSGTAAAAAAAAPTAAAPSADADTSHSTDAQAHKHKKRKAE